MGTRTHTHIEMKSLIGFYIGQRPSENLCEKCFGSTFDLFAFGGFHRIVNVRYCFGAHHSFPLNIIMPMRRLLFLSVSVFELGQIFQSKWNQCRWFSFEINKCPLINIWRVKRVFFAHKRSMFIYVQLNFIKPRSLMSILLEMRLRVGSHTLSVKLKWAPFASHIDCSQTPVSWFIVDSLPYSSNDFAWNAHNAKSVLLQGRFQYSNYLNDARFSIYWRCRCVFKMALI